MARYAMVDAEGNVTNICEWDGESNWAPPDGITLVECDGHPEAERGGTYINGTFARMTDPEPVAEEPAL